MEKIDIAPMMEPLIKFTTAAAEMYRFLTRIRAVNGLPSNSTFDGPDMKKLMDITFGPFIFDGDTIKYVGKTDPVEGIAKFRIRDLTHDIDEEDVSYSELRLLEAGGVRPVDALILLAYENAFTHEMLKALPNNRLKKPLDALCRMLDEAYSLFLSGIGDGCVRMRLSDSDKFIALMRKAIPRRQATWDRFLTL